MWITYWLLQSQTSPDINLRRRHKSPTPTYNEDDTSNFFQLDFTNLDKKTQPRMDVAVEIMDVRLYQSETEKTLVSFESNK